MWSDVEKIVLHDGYNRHARKHDIALIKLGAQAPESRAIALARLADPPVGQPLEVTGWGGTLHGGDPSRVLLKANVPFADNGVCNQSSAYSGKLHPGVLCAGHEDSGIDSCQGDIGGPLVWRRSPDDPVLVGVVAWSDGCARKLRYGVYTRVASYAEWIREVVAKNAP
jgi:secreted trypsin-like serine protease